MHSTVLLVAAAKRRAQRTGEASAKRTKHYSTATGKASAKRTTHYRYW